MDAADRINPVAMVSNTGPTEHATFNLSYCRPRHYTFSTQAYMPSLKVGGAAIIS